MSTRKKNSGDEFLDADDRKEIVSALMRIVRSDDNRLALRAIGKLLSLEARNQKDSASDATQ